MTSVSPSSSSSVRDAEEGDREVTVGRRHVEPVAVLLEVRAAELQAHASRLASHFVSTGSSAGWVLHRVRGLVAGVVGGGPERGGHGDHTGSGHRTCCGAGCPGPGGSRRRAGCRRGGPTTSSSRGWPRFSSFAGRWMRSRSRCWPRSMSGSFRGSGCSGPRPRTGSPTWSGGPAATGSGRCGTPGP